MLRDQKNVRISLVIRYDQYRAILRNIFLAVYFVGYLQFWIDIVCKSGSTLDLDISCQCVVPFFSGLPYSWTGVGIEIVDS